MFCRNCGAQIGDNASFCSKCGAATGVSNTQQQRAPSNPPQGNYQQPGGGYQPPQGSYGQPPQGSYGQPYGQVQYAQPFVPVQPLPMKWFKFLIYFALFAGALSNAVSGVMMLTGTHYDLFGSGMADKVYDEFSGLMTLDMACGAGMLVVAVLSIVARFRLSGYYKDGPKLLNAVYLAGAVVNLVYVMGAYFVFPEEVVNAIDTTSYFTSFAVSMAMVSANTTYFRKRAALFGR